MDGWMDISEYYTIDSKTNKFIAPKLFSEKSFNDSTLKVCPERSCLRPIHRVNRYGRVIKKNLIDNTEKKFIVNGRLAVSSFQDDVANARELIVTEQAKQSTLNHLAKRISELQEKIFFRDKNCPSARVYEMCQSFIKRSWSGDSERAMQLINVPKPDQIVLCDMKIALAELHLMVGVMQCRVLLSRREKKPTGKNQARNNTKIFEVCLEDYTTGMNILENLWQPALNSGLIAKTATILYKIALLKFEFCDGLAKLAFKTAPIKAQLLEILSAAKQSLPQCQTYDASLAYGERIATLFEKIQKLSVSIENDGAFYSSVSMEEKKAVFEALQKGDPNFSPDVALHWFTCPKGHIFTIGECGHAMAVGKCIECGERVGGTDHRMPEHKATDFLKDVQKK